MALRLRYRVSVVYTEHVTESDDSVDIMIISIFVGFRMFLGIISEFILFACFDHYS